MLSVDPGGHAGYATFMGEHMKQSGIVSGDSVKDVRFILDLLKPEMLVIEDQYIPTGTDKKGRSKVLNQKGLKTLMLRRHIWDVLAMERGIRIETVNPATWQAYFKLRRGDKEGIVKLASVLVEKDLVQMDEADAILIGWWWTHSQSATLKGGRR